MIDGSRSGFEVSSTPEEKNSDFWSNVYILTITIGVIITTLGVAATIRQKHWSDKVAAAQRLQSLSLAVKLQEAQNNAKQIDVNLLNEQRLTSSERWRLRRVERAVLPRSLFVNWPALASELKAGHFQPINIAVVDKPEPSLFAINFMMALQQAGLNAQLILITDQSSAKLGTSSSGVVTFVANSDGSRLSEMLWKRFRIGGASVLMVSPALVPAMIPRETNCLMITENNWALAPTDGQDGEGVDEHGRPVPPP